MDSQIKSGNDEGRKERTEEITEEKGKRNADRRVSNRPHHFGCGSVLGGARSPVGVPPRLLLGMSEHLRPASGQASWDAAAIPMPIAKRALPAPACPSPVAPTAGHSAGGVIPKAARGKFARLPAGTALAPYVGSHPEYVPDVSKIEGECN